MIKTSPFLWNGSSKIQFLTVIWYQFLALLLLIITHCSLSTFSNNGVNKGSMTKKALLYITSNFLMMSLKFRHYEKATKSEKNIPHVSTKQLFSLSSGRFFQIFVAFSEKLAFVIMAQKDYLCNGWTIWCHIRTLLPYCPAIIVL